MTILEGHLSKSQLAEQLGRSVRALDRWERQRIGPPRIKVGKLILYRVESVQAWLASREQRHNTRGSR